MSEEVEYPRLIPWMARFERGSTLSQFDPSSGKETLFREVLLRELKDDLLNFTVGNVTLDMKEGSFIIHENGKAFKLIPSCGKVKEMMDEYGLEEERRRSKLQGQILKRLIYFRRRSTDFGADVKPDRIVYALGWQATVDGRNVKHILYIHPNGDLVLG